MWDPPITLDDIIDMQTSRGVTVIRRCVPEDFQSELAMRTLEVLRSRLGQKEKLQSEAIDPEDLASLAFGVLERQQELGTIYVNPMFVVTADTDTPKFYRRVRQCRLIWLDWWNFLGRAALKRELRLDDLTFPGMPNGFRKLARVLIRELRFTGVFSLSGASTDPRKRRNLIRKGES
jgi:hypothetical protein